jgi:hypothetical protein
MLAGQNAPSQPAAVNALVPIRIIPRFIVYQTLRFQSSLGCIIRHMRVEEFEKLTKKQLRAKANECFTKAEPAAVLVRTALVTEARFYLDELNRRADSRVAIRDLILEIVVILLIGGEIILGVFQGKQQADAFNKMQGVLSSLQTSSEATAKTLIALQKTTESMNEAIQKELSLFYDVSVSTTYSVTDRRLTVTNMGRTNIVVGRIEIANVVALAIAEGRALTPQSTFNADLTSTPAYDLIVRQAAQEKDGLTPFDVYVRNERREEFVIHSYFVVKDKAIANVQEGSITPQHWSSKTK